jgi:hypothetical protein
MGSSDRGILVAGTPEDPKVSIGGSGVKEQSEVWGLRSPLWVGG